MTHTYVNSHYDQPKVVWGFGHIQRKPPEAPVNSGTLKGREILGGAEGELLIGLHGNHQSMCQNLS